MGRVEQFGSNPFRVGLLYPGVEELMRVLDPLVTTKTYRKR